MTLPAPNPIPARLVCLHFSRLSPGIAVQRSEKQINIGWKVSVRSRASKCPTQLTVDGGSVDLIVWEWWRRSLNLVCLCAPWSNNGPHCLTVWRWEMLSRRRGPSTLPRHPVIRTQTRGADRDQEWEGGGSRNIRILNGKFKKKLLGVQRFISF